MLFNLLSIPANPLKNSHINTKSHQAQIAKAAKRVAATLSGLSSETLIAVNQPLAKEMEGAENMKFITKATIRGSVVSVFSPVGETYEKKKPDQKQAAQRMHCAVQEMVEK